ncbi:MAG: FHA domain-containing protein [Bdellovibrionales bacterium]|nr:FHA domain-containing protein [Bdellovibrionales bacterium]
MGCLKIRILNGTQAQQEWELRDGFSIGRSRGDILLDDSRVSGLHATVQYDTLNQSWLLKDNKSKNGIKIDGQVTPFVVLKPNLKFFIGQTEFQVVEEIKTGSEELLTQVNATIKSSQNSPQNSPEAPPPPPDKLQESQKERRRWHEILADYFLKNIPTRQNHSNEVTALEFPVRLTFLSGVQKQTRWTLGYGPRHVGAHSTDLPIFESGAPPFCFSILPRPHGVDFQTDSPDLVLINGNSLPHRLLEHGDIISFGETRIEVEIIK